MIDCDDVTPQLAVLIGKGDAPVRDSKHFLTKIRITTTVSIPVLSGMYPQSIGFSEVCGDVPPAVALTGSAIPLVAVAFLIANSKVETVGGRDISS